MGNKNVQGGFIYFVCVGGYSGIAKICFFAREIQFWKQFGYHLKTSLSNEGKVIGHFLCNFFE